MGFGVSTPGSGQFSILMRLLDFILWPSKIFWSDFWLSHEVVLFLWRVFSWFFCCSSFSLAYIMEMANMIEYDILNFLNGCFVTFCNKSNRKKKQQSPDYGASKLVQTHRRTKINEPVAATQNPRKNKNRKRPRWHSLKMPKKNTTFAKNRIT